MYMHNSNTNRKDRQTTFSDWAPRGAAVQRKAHLSSISNVTWKDHTAENR